MLWKHFTTAAGLAATAAHAFVVPEITGADKDIVNALPVHNALPFEITDSSVETRKLKLDCPGCPIKLGVDTKTDVKNHLDLVFTIDGSGPVDRLLVNDFALYPKTSSWYSSLRAPQVPDFIKEATKHRFKGTPRTPQLGYSLSTKSLAKEDADQQLELIQLDLQVIEVGNYFVDGIPNINVKLVKTPAGKLMIAAIDAVETRPADQTPEDECRTFACKFFKSLKNMRPGCGRKHGMGHAGHHTGHHGHHGHEHMRSHHTWRQLAKMITWGIILPIFVGLIAGVTVSIIGMAVGTAIVCLWRLVVRRESPWVRHQCRRRAQASPKASRHESAVAEEKSGLLESQADDDVADLPPYEEEPKATQP
ncbi:hypothetical protein BN1708_004300 [Verticillium longisporum]|uniref:DUF7728 domain-containing protein n=1 Tax=Verticillium longisporum TaxID=100787 RepID=A0A0G4LY97_VERLO|nr:hypothetical protein BN1708_004300 [Verticillium longisporum]